MKQILILYYFILLIFIGCKPADFSISSPKVAKATFNHTAFLNTSCVQCHEAKRPVTSPAHGSGKDCINCHSAALNSQGVRAWLNVTHFDHNPLPTSCNQCHESTRPNGSWGKASIYPHLTGQWGATQDCASCHIYNKWKGKQGDGSDYVHFDHNKPITNCNECHKSPTRDDRPTSSNSTLVETTSPFHPQTYFDSLKNLLTGFNDGTIKTANNSLVGLTTNQSTLLSHINSKQFANSDQMDCIICHENASNTKSWSLRHATKPQSLIFKYNNPIVNPHLIVSPTNTASTSEPAQCLTCHENHRPATHISMDTYKTILATGMNTGDCKGCHVYTKSGSVPAAVIGDWSSPIAFDHVNASPVTCKDCHTNSVPYSQRGSVLTNSTHPVATGTYYKVDCVRCHTYDASLTPPYASAPARSWANIAFDYRTHLKADGVTGPSTCLQCHKVENNSLPNSLINPSHTAGSRLNAGECLICHDFKATTKWYTFVSDFDHVKYLDTKGSADRCDSCHKNSTMINSTIKNPLTNIPALETRPTNPVVHVPVTGGIDCNSCHKDTIDWKTSVTYSHGASDSCASCHNLSNPKNLAMPAVVQKGSNHFPIGTLECSTCHTAANTMVASVSYKTFQNSVFSHTNTNNVSCATCHNDVTYAGTVAKQLPLPQGTAHLTLPQGSDCSTCHTSTTTFTGMSGGSIYVTYTHNPALDVNCNSCHRGITGFAKGTNSASNPTHMLIPYEVSGGTVTTNKVQCSTCHQEVNALGTALSVRTTPDFKIHTTANTSTDTRCTICHDGANATGKTTADYNLHPNVGTLQCASCHQHSLNTNPKYQDFTGGGFAHTSTVTSNNTSCNTCHSNGSTIAKKPSDYAGHVPSNSECVACHTASLETFTNFSGGNYPHSDNVSCATCHGTASVTSVTQKSNTTIHNAATAACNTCHNNTVSFTTWSIHNNTTTTNNTACNSCHTGLVNTYGKQKSAYTGHILSTAECITCHSTTPSKTPPFADFTGGVYNHTGSESCTTCHANSSANVTQVTNTIVHTTNAASTCISCHTNTAAYTTWKIHTGAATSNLNSCNTCHVVTSTPLVLKNISNNNTYNHFSITKANSNPAECIACHQTSTSPLGSGNSFTGVNFRSGLLHTNAVAATITTTNSCTTCHTSAYSSASATILKMLPSTTATPALHLPVPVVVATGFATQCDSCHKDASFASWKGMNLSTPTSSNVLYTHNINATTDVTCTACHSGASGFAEGKNHYKNTSGVTLHMTTTAQCSTCHQDADAGGTLTIKTTNFSIHTTVATQTDTRCNICHNGGGAIAKTPAAYANHQAVTTDQCVLCHQSSLGSTPKYLSFSGGNAHTAASTSNFLSCNECHLSAGGVIQNINNSPNYNHFAITKANSTKAECYVCHGASVNSGNPSLGFKNFSGGVYHTASSGVVGTCTSCHKPSVAYTPFVQYPSTHLPLPSGSECSTCHVTSAFTTGTFKGMPLTTGTSNVTFTHSAANDGNCVTCHTGATGFAEGTSNTPGATHITLPKSSGVNVSCDTCHNIKTSAGAVWKGIASKVVNPAPVTVAYNHLTIGSTACNTCHRDETGGGSVTHGVPTSTAQAATSPYTPAAHILTAGSDCIGCHTISKNGGAIYNTKTFTAYESFYGGINKDHSSATTNCLGCHWTGDGVTGTIRNAPNTVGGFKHLPMTDISTSTVAQCSTCHQASTTGGSAFTTFAGGNYHNNATSSKVAGTCTSCHKGAVTFTGTTTYPATHLALPGGSECSTCHNKDNSFTSWKGMLSAGVATVKVSYTHNTGADTTCNTCHQTNTSGSPYINKVGYATGYTNTTIHTSNTAVQCSICHQAVSGATVTTKFSADFKIHDSTNTTNDTKCNACHLSGSAINKYNNYTNTGFSHFPYVNGTTYAECQTCHQASINVVAPAVKYGSFAGGELHNKTLISNVPTTTCASCHKASGVAYTNVKAISSLATHVALPVPTTPVGNTTPVDCNACHTSSGWTGTVYNSATVRVNYSHNINATTDANCSSCHTGAARFATGKTNTLTVHGTAAGAQQCNICHKLVSATSTLSDKTTSNFLIHDTTNITASKNRCNVCHLDTTTSSATVATIKFFDATGAYTHLPIKTTATTATYAECSTCHSGSIGGTVAPFISSYNFNNGKFHSKVTAASMSAATCATCHNSTYTYGASNFKKLPATHLSIVATTGVTANAECSACHKVTNDSTTASNLWTGMAIANTLNSAIAINVAYNHKAGDTACSTCHTGATAFAEGNLSGGNGHLTIPLAPLQAVTKAQCSACHNVGITGLSTTLDSWKSWRLATPQVIYNAHNTSVITNCSTCHTNAAGFAKGTSFDTNHPSTSGLGECSSCHSYASLSAGAGTTTYTDFKSPRDHRAGANCISCHYNAGTFTNINANPTYKHFPILNSSSTAVQCSICHTASMTTYTNFTGGVLHSKAAANSITLTANCTNCHTTTYSTTATSFKAVTATHLITPAGTNCDSCHNIGTASGLVWKGMPLTAATTTVTYTHPASMPVTCTSCHSGTTTSSGLAEGTANTTNSFTHITLPQVSGTAVDCSTCHTSKTTWTGIKTNPKNVLYTHTTADQVTCNSCHTGSLDSSPVQHGGAIGTAYAVVATGNAHVALNGSDCKGCHSASLVTFTSFAGGSLMDHNIGANCINCHWNIGTSSIANINNSPGYSHFPITVGGNPVQCSTCHSASQQPGRNYNNFTGGNLHENVTTSGLSTTSCSSCHNASYTYGATSFFKLPTVGTLHLNPSQPNLAATGTSINRGECSICHTVTNNSASFDNTWKTWRAPLANSKPVSFTTGGSFTTTAAHGFTVNDPVSFKSDSSLPAQILSGSTYYIKTVPTTTTFTISSTVGGAAMTTLSVASSGSNYVMPVVTFNAPTFATVSSVSASLSTTLTFTAASSAITMGSALALAVGDPVQLTGTVPTNFSTNAIYYVKTIAGTAITLGISNNNGTIGAAIIPANAAVGTTLVSSNVFTTAAAHGITAAMLPAPVTIRGTLPAGLVADQVYYVSAVPTTTKFLLSSTVASSMTFSTTSVNIASNTTATGAATSVTFAKALAATVTYSGHGLVAGDQVSFKSTGTLPTGIANGQFYQVNTVSGSTFTLKSIPNTLLWVAGSTYAPTLNILSALAATGTVTLTKPAKTIYQAHTTASDTNCNACHTGAVGFAKGVSSITAANGSTALHVGIAANQCSACHTGTVVTTTTTYTGFTGGNYNHTTGSNTFSVAGAYHANQKACNICHNNYTSQPASAATVMWTNTETGIKNSCLGCHTAAFGFNNLHMSLSSVSAAMRATGGSNTATTFGIPTAAAVTTAAHSGRPKCLSCHNYGTGGTGTTINATDGNQVRGYTPLTAQ